MKTLHRSKARCIFIVVIFLASILACGESGTMVPTPASVEPTAVPSPSDIVHEFYTSPAGHGNACTLEVPCSLETACDKVRSVNKDMTGDIVVYLRGGIYTLTETLTFGPEDAGSNGHYIVYRAYQNESPHFSGGQQIAGWTDLGNGIYQAPVDLGRFRQLYVNGQRAIRARTPNMTDPATFGPYHRLLSWDSKSRGIKIQKEAITDWRGLNDVEMVIKKHWNQSRLRIDSYSMFEDHALVTFREPEVSAEWSFEWPPKDSQQSYYFENSLDFLDTEKEWFLDTETQTLYYMPHGDEDLLSSVVIAPVLERLVDINDAHHLKFENIVFEHVNWDMPNEAHFGLQSGWRLEWGMIPGGVRLVNAHHIRFEENTFQHMGGGGIEFSHSTHDNVIHNNIITDISGNGITVYTDTDNDNPPEEHQSRHDIISHNQISRIGQDYTGSTGINATYPQGIIIEHNEVWDMPSTGISVGWGWTGETTALRDNIIRYNNVHHVMQLHDDGAGIYTLSKQPGTHLLENHVHDLQHSEWAVQDWPIAGTRLVTVSITGITNPTLACCVG
ncbi:right-handed parallel beta-helix repeat-containing protein [Chloroflexota bacterium]